MGFYKVSIIIPTYNSLKTLGACLESIKEQSYPSPNLEIIIVDGGSTDGTLELASKFKITRVLKNSLKTGEAGKVLGVKSASGEIIAFIDSDNILPGRDWLKEMVIPFEDPAMVAAEPLYYTYRRTDPLINRYFALLGMNDPLCLYLGNYDRYSYLTDRWTGFDLEVKDKGLYLEVTLVEGKIPTMGANGFLIRREALLKINFKDYLFDLDMVYDLVQKGHNKFAKVKIGLIHLFAADTRTFIRKQRRRIKDYLYFQERRTYPWRSFSKRDILKFILNTLLIWPRIFEIIKGYSRVRDRAWLFHLPACWLTLLVYFFMVIRYRKEN